MQVFKSSIEADTSELNWNIEEFETIDKSIDTLLKYLEKDLPYIEKLNFHFLNSTAIWMPRIDQEVFATLTSTDLNIISNTTLKKELTSYYSFAKRRFDIYINRYASIMEDASKNIFSTRFNELWNTKKGAMVPHDYEALKKDNEYLYFLRSLKHQLWFYIREPLQNAKKRADTLLESLEKEYRKLEQK